MAISYARAGASSIAISARRVADLATTTVAIKAAAAAAGRSNEPQVLGVALEVSSVESMAAAAAAVSAAFGARLDVVVANAGRFAGTRPPARIADPATDVDQWWASYEVNVKGLFLTARTFVPLLLGTEGGLKTFVTVGSVAGLMVAPMFSQYHPTKLTALRLTEFIDAEYAGEGLTAFTIHPGYVPTGTCLACFCEFEPSPGTLSTPYRAGNLFVDDCFPCRHEWRA